MYPSPELMSTVVFKRSSGFTHSLANILRKISLLHTGDGYARSDCAVAAANADLPKLSLEASLQCLSTPLNLCKFKAHSLSLLHWSSR